MMETAKFEASIAWLSAKIEKLIAANQDLKRQLAACQNENMELKSRSQERLNSDEGFQNQIILSKIVDSISVDLRDTAALKNLINEHIKEIDNCLEQLSQ